MLKRVVGIWTEGSMAEEELVMGHKNASPRVPPSPHSMYASREQIVTVSDTIVGFHRQYSFILTLT